MRRSTTWVADAVGAPAPSAEVLVEGSVETDSRECSPGSLYVARQGESADGHAFIDSAVTAGAVAVICEHPVHADVPQIIVPDATAALGDLARRYLQELRESGDLTVIGITGSAGKTTTKDLLGNLLSRVGQAVWPVASFNNEVGCPLTVLRADEDTRFLVLEMGSSGPGHLRYLTEIAPLDIAVELLVGAAHLGGFGSVEVLAASKAELLEGLLPGGTAVLNLDDPWVSQMVPPLGTELLYFSAAGVAEAQVRAGNVVLDEFGHPGFTLSYEEETAPVTLRLVGAHQVSNALAAAACALSAGADFAAVVAALNQIGPVSPHRMDVRMPVHWRGKEDLTIIDDAYNANPDSLASGLKAARQIAKDGRLIAVIGEMLELGEFSDQLHAEAAQEVTQAGVTALIGVGTGVKPLLESLPQHTQSLFAADANTATEMLPALLRRGDTVFLKGSYGSEVWRVADAINGK